MNVAKAMSILKEKGYKHTQKREDILQLFSEQKRYLSAKDVLENMKGDFPGLSFDTIYRNLSVFAELNILETTELEGEKRFRFSCSTHGHHHHLICLDCGKTQSIKTCPMEQVSADLQNFSIVDHKFEVYGYCGECRQ
jgi:Fur family zinc uptake transcriptional regulator